MKNLDLQALKKVTGGSRDGGATLPPPKPKSAPIYIDPTTITTTP